MRLITLDMSLEVLYINLMAGHDECADAASGAMRPVAT